MSAARCAIWRGFFVLRACGRPAVAACAICGRAVCAEHVAVVGGLPRCAECRAGAGTERDWGDWDSDLAAFAYRQRFFSTRPNHHWHYSSYDTHDYSAFDSGPSDPTSGDPVGGGGGFYDS